MTPYAVSQMSDEEIAEELRQRWDLIVMLLDAAGGEVRINEERIVRMNFEKATVEKHRDFATMQLVYRLNSLE